MSLFALMGVITAAVAVPVIVLVVALLPPLNKCPACGEPAPRFRKLSNRQQFLWGGWTCAKCGCEIDWWGRKKSEMRRYTDLDFTSTNDLTALAVAFETAGFPGTLRQSDDGLWSATFEADEPHAEPEPCIAALLAFIEALAPPLRPIWAGCTRREFNIWCDCGPEPWAFNQGLSADLLARMAAAGASLRITLGSAQAPPVQGAGVGQRA